ncbi:MAG: hypothetical protein KKG60_01485 [Nanoarchaeota archaeon]|nr:hypothetical protein [Nanoarchaeota archaeon]
MEEEKVCERPLRMDEYHELEGNVLGKCSDRSIKLICATIPGWLATGYGCISSFVQDISSFGQDYGGAMGDSYSNLEIGCVIGGMVWVALSGLPALISMFSTRDTLRRESYKNGFEREYYIVNSW